MQEMTSCVNTVLFLILWTLKLCQCGSHANCDLTESYDAVVTISVKEPVYVTKYKWCWDVPPRCSDNKLEYRIVHKNITVPKTRVVKRCCKDKIQLYDNCIPKCNDDRCPNIQCAPGTDKCKCKSGFTGYLCNQKCGVGYWGMACKNTCNRACPDCDHRTGCCKTMVSDDLETISGLTFCTSVKTPSKISVTENSTEYNYDDENMNRTTRSQIKIFSTVTHEPLVVEPDEMQIQTNVTRNTVETQKSNTSVTKNQSMDENIAVEETSLSTSSSSSPLPPTPPSPSKRSQKDGAGFVSTVTKVEVMVYKYDDLVKKLICISAMTVLAIAMVFIIMFVMFLNCYGVSKVDDRIQNRQSMPAAINKFNETCISTQNLGQIPPDRYTKAPALCTSNNDGLPIHPNIFCPVFSAPHKTDGSSIYDSPQPLYEILC